MKRGFARRCLRVQLERGKTLLAVALASAGALILMEATAGPVDGSTAHEASQESLEGQDARPPGGAGRSRDRGLDARLERVLRRVGFTGKFGLDATLLERLGRPLDPQLVELGRLLWFDTAHSLHLDNTCGGCHSPTNGFGDAQPMAIGVDSNRKVGPGRVGPRNQRRSPLVINNAFYPKLMWNGRFSAESGDPFDNSEGFRFPPPEGLDRFPSEDVAPPGDPWNLDDRGITHLLQAQAHIPPTETVEVAGFNNICEQEGFDGPLCQFDHSEPVVGPERAHGLDLPLPVLDPETGDFFRNEPIRQKGLDELSAVPEYVTLFTEAFPDDPDPIDFDNFGKAIAEFEFTLTFADAPLDRFARGDHDAMTASQKRGALLFFGKARCVRCHQVAGPSNEMFSDFENHVIGVPQIFPFFGWPTGNLPFDGPGENEDFGQEQISGDPRDRYAFRTAPLRNLKLAPAYMHNGAFTQLEDAIRHHLNVWYSALTYDPADAGVPPDLQQVGPILPVLLRLDPRLWWPIHLSPREFEDLVTFVRDGLYDERAAPEHLCTLVPSELPGGRPVELDFEACAAN